MRVLCATSAVVPYGSGFVASSGCTAKAGPRRPEPAEPEVLDLALPIGVIGEQVAVDAEAVVGYGELFAQESNEEHEHLRVGVDPP